MHQPKNSADRLAFAGSRMLATFAFAAVMGVARVLAAEALKAEAPPLDFVVGDYVIIGREPDGGATYSGSARIALAGGSLVLERSRADHRVSATGRLEVPSPPGEGRVLRFRWKDPEPVTETCLIGSDLDNYARLTCYWLRDGSEPRQPGLEAMFSTADWPGASGNH
jgi:hypothetical protein